MAIRRPKESIPDDMSEAHEVQLDAVTAEHAGTSDIVTYIRDMTAELRDLANSRDLLLLSYLLDMAHQEARGEPCSGRSAKSKR